VVSVKSTVRGTAPEVGEPLNDARIPEADAVVVDVAVVVTFDVAVTVGVPVAVVVSAVTVADSTTI